MDFVMIEAHRNYEISQYSVSFSDALCIVYICMITKCCYYVKEFSCCNHVIHLQLKVITVRKE